MEEELARKLQKLFYFTSDETAALLRHVEIFALPPDCKIVLPSLTNQPAADKPIPVGWYGDRDPLVVFRAADLPRFCLIAAQLMAGQS